MRIESHTRQPDPVRAPETARELERACRDVEALFLKQLLAEMHRAGGQMIQGGPGSDVYQELFDHALAQHLARTSSLGIARLLQRELARSTPASPASRPSEPPSAAAQDSALKVEGETAE